MSLFYKLTATLGNGSTQAMKAFEGKVVYATNVARELYSSDQLVILGFPSREFGAQEYKTDEEIAAFAAQKKFPGIMMKLGKVTGPGASEVWKFFMKATQAKEPVWNFDGKFLVSKTGQIMLPSDDLESDIAKLVEE